MVMTTAAESGSSFAEAIMDATAAGASVIRAFTIGSLRSITHLSK
jgi:hypothetical protein